MLAMDKNLEKKMGAFVVNVHPVHKEPKQIEGMKDTEILVDFGGAYVRVTAPEDTTYGEIERAVYEYFKPFREIKPTEIRTVGYSGPV